ncbi:hypothetical protein CBM2608_A240086 [Cupriavidus taiwanensis]|nr:hypothetical protein CBM2608_A240086 [Cupriavidus taiwanensis]
MAGARRRQHAAGRRALGRRAGAGDLCPRPVRRSRRLPGAAALGRAGPGAGGRSRRAARSVDRAPGRHHGRAPGPGGTAGAVAALTLPRRCHGAATAGRRGPARIANLSHSQRGMAWLVRHIPRLAASAQRTSPRHGHRPPARRPRQAASLYRPQSRPAVRPDGADRHDHRLAR